jgi:hypothetical protein
MAEVPDDNCSRFVRPMEPTTVRAGAMPPLQVEAGRDSHASPAYSMFAGATTCRSACPGAIGVAAFGRGVRCGNANSSPGAVDYYRRLLRVSATVRRSLRPAPINQAVPFGTSLDRCGQNRSRF